MTENEYMIVGNLARIRAAMDVLRDVVIIDNCKAADKYAKAFMALCEVEADLSKQVPRLVQSS